MPTRSFNSEYEMAVRIRLKRMGRKKAPHYRVVVETLGYYKPLSNPARLVLDLERVDYWVGQGASPSGTVRSLILKARAGGDSTVAVGEEDVEAKRKAEQERLAARRAAEKAEAAEAAKAEADAKAAAKAEAEAAAKAEAEAAEEEAAAEAEEEPAAEAEEEPAAEAEEEPAAEAEEEPAAEAASEGDDEEEKSE